MCSTGQRTCSLTIDYMLLASGDWPLAKALMGKPPMHPHTTYSLDSSLFAPLLLLVNSPNYPPPTHTHTHFVFSTAIDTSVKIQLLIVSELTNSYWIVTESFVLRCTSSKPSWNLQQQDLDCSVCFRQWTLFSVLILVHNTTSVVGCKALCRPRLIHPYGSQALITPLLVNPIMIIEVRVLLWTCSMITQVLSLFLTCLIYMWN